MPSYWVIFCERIWGEWGRSVIDICVLQGSMKKSMLWNNLASDFAKCLAGLCVSWKCSASHGLWSWMWTWLFHCFRRYFQCRSTILNKTGLWPVFVPWDGAIPSASQTSQLLLYSRALLFLKNHVSLRCPVTNWLSSVRLLMTPKGWLWGSC